MAKHVATRTDRAPTGRALRAGWRRTGRAERSRAESPSVESLERRRLLTAFSWSGEEVYLLELINRARQDPVAEGNRVGLDLTVGLSAAQLANLVPQEPLALSESLTIAMRAHALDMAERDFFDHYNPEGESPTDRAQEAGYIGVAGENIAAGYTSVDLAHRAWLESLGHRLNTLSLHANFNDGFHYDEIGVAVEFTDFGPYYRFYGELFGVPTAPKTFILGVVYDDANGNDFYGVGEGQAGVRVDVINTNDTSSVAATYLTDDAGNYQLEVGPGQYIVRFTDTSTGAVKVSVVTVADQNMKVDGQMDDFVSTAGDVADFPDWANAGVIPWADQSGGVGATTGSIGFIGDTDVFQITAGASGDAFAIIAGSLGLDSTISVYTSTGQLIADASDSGNGGTVNFTAVQGQTYLFLVRADDAISTGSYAIGVQLPAPGPGGGGGDDPIDYSGSEDSAFGVVSLGNDQIAITATGADGTPYFFVRGLVGNWTGVDLSGVAGGALDSDRVVTWTEDGNQRVAANTSTGLVLFEEDAGTWTARNLTSQLGGAQLREGSITTFTSPFGITYVAGLDDAGDLIFYRETGVSSGGQSVWTSVNIAEAQLRPNGVEMPDIQGPLISYVTRGARLNIAGIDADGNIHVFFRRPGLTAWQELNFTDLWDAPSVATGLGVHTRPFGGINIAGVTTGGEVVTTYWVPGYDRWESLNVTQASGGPLVRAGTLTAYGNVWGGPNFAAIDNSGNSIVFWTLPNNAGWRSTNLNSVVGGSPTAASGLIASRDADSAQISLFGVDTDGDLFRFFWRPGLGWASEDVTTPAV